MKEQIKRERKEKDVFFEKHPQSPIPVEKRKNFEGLNYYPINSEFRFELKLYEYDDKEEINVEDSKGGQKRYIRWGRFIFEINGKEYSLNAYKSSREEEMLWVPFKDKPNGKETYGAGRYIDLEPSENRKNGKWILDFNEAYNPFCAYNEGYVCPFIPPENWLEVDIKAGEKIPDKEED
ncbi:MAG: DUF1684 domain-containing protein [Candidatus Aenigmatarchaeota archaeon]